MDKIRTETSDVNDAVQPARLDRRRLLLSAGALGLSRAMVRSGAAWAQDASPAAGSPAPGTGGGNVIKSLTRDEFNAEMVKDLGYTEGKPGGTFLDSNTADIQTVMPFLADENASLGIVGLIFDTITGGDPRTGQPAPNGLADWWELAADDVTYTFHLNQKAKWHDGQPVTAADVAFSFDALHDPDTGSAYTGAFNDSVKSWKAIDDHTFQIVAKQPTITLLYDLVAFIIPKHIWENVPRKKWQTDPGATGQDPKRVIGSGPFKFEEWKPGESVTLVRNDDYYDKVPYIERYSMRIWPDQTSVVNAFLNDEIDATGLEPADVGGVQGQPGIEIETYPTRGFTYVPFNLDPKITTLFQDKRVRQAMMYGLDRQSIVDDILLGYAEVAQGTQPKVSYAYAPDRITTKYGYEPDKAKQLLADAGWKDSNGDGVVEKDGQAMQFEFLYPSGSPTTDQIVAYIQDAWKKIGVAMTPRSLEFPAMLKELQETHQFRSAALGFNWDATFIQDAMFGCAQYQGGFNFMKYCNPDLDKINAQAKIAFDQAKRADLLIEASNIVNDELPVLVLHFRKGIDAHHDRLQNYKPNTWGSPLNYIWFKG
jgi:peptide/nickel transport system substrate-binding protein